MPDKIIAKRPMTRNRLKQARRKRDLDVADIASSLGISESFYYKIEQGTRNPRMDLARRIANLLGDTVDSLFFTEDLDGSSKDKRYGAGGHSSQATNSA